MWKECCDQEGDVLSPSPHSFINLDVMISWIATILEPYFPHLQNEEIKTCPAFSLGLSSWPNASIGGVRERGSSDSATM